MDKFKALVIMLWIVVLGSSVIDLYFDNKELTDEVEIYKNAYINLYANKEEQRETLERVEIASEIYSVEPQLLEAIERLETGNYTSEIYHNNNNTWGAFDGVNYLEFDSELQSTIELARTLKFNYIDMGLDTIEEIGEKYCPNDENWALKVKQIYEVLKDEE